MPRKKKGLWSLELPASIPSKVFELTFSWGNLSKSFSQKVLSGVVFPWEETYCGVYFITASLGLVVGDCTDSMAKPRKTRERLLNTFQQSFFLSRV